MHIVVAFMKNGNGIRYEVSQEEWVQVVESPVRDYLQFKTLKGSTVRLNLRETIAVEFQHESGIAKLPN